MLIYLFEKDVLRLIASLLTELVWLNCQPGSPDEAMAVFVTKRHIHIGRVYADDRRQSVERKPSLREMWVWTGNVAKFRAAKLENGKTFKNIFIVLSTEKDDSKALWSSRVRFLLRIEIEAMGRLSSTRSCSKRRSSSSLTAPKRCWNMGACSGVQTMRLIMVDLCKAERGCKWTIKNDDGFGWSHLKLKSAVHVMKSN